MAQFHQELFPAL
uniref:Uncharacterized protein n=1 Tax=Anguilla anguilla TaxID=7936 RepID=A0A0E9XB40_ANGAN